MELYLDTANVAEVERLARIYPFVICIMIGELVGTLAAGAIWIGTGFGLAMNRPWAEKANIAIQMF